MRTAARGTARPAAAAVALLLTAAAVGLLAAAAGASPRAQLEDRIRQVLAPLGGTSGVALTHVQTGEETSLVIGASRFPMASVAKLPIAIVVLQRVDAGTLRLDQPVVLERRHLRPGPSPLRLTGGQTSLRVPLRRLIELMMGQSDNTASDAVLRLAGGPAVVTRRLLDLGISGMDVSRDEAHLMADWYGVERLPPENAWSRERLTSLYAAVPVARRHEAVRRFARDGRDTATPEAAAELLVRLQRGQLLSAASTAFLRGAMERSTTGAARLRGLLPPGTAVASKTGTLGGVVNDAGLITLPGRRGHLAVAVFLNCSGSARERCERAIARIARIAYDYYSGRAG